MQISRNACCIIKLLDIHDSCFLQQKLLECLEEALGPRVYFMAVIEFQVRSFKLVVS